MSIGPEQEDLHGDGGSRPADGERHGGAGNPSQWSRRRFGKAALVATPVLATLYGRPLRAAPNCSPSGWVSGNTSLHHELEDCGGNTPGYWQGPASKTQHRRWDEIHQEELDSPLGFPGLGRYSLAAKPGEDANAVREATLQNAVEGPGQTPFLGTGTLERQLIRFGTAALLNARFVMGYALTEAQVTEMVAMAVLHGGYTTPSGDFLTPGQVKAFLENTMDMPGWGP